MKRLIVFGMMCIFPMMLSVCPHSLSADTLETDMEDFPSPRLYTVESCEKEKDSGMHLCGKFAIGSEFAILKETDSDNWKLWRKPPGDASPGVAVIEEVCTGSVNGNRFTCGGLCGKPENIIKITQRHPCACQNYNHCVQFEFEGDTCPDGGSGKGGHN